MIGNNNKTIGLPEGCGWIRYQLAEYGMEVETPAGERMERILLLSLFFPVLLIGYFWNYRDWKKTSSRAHQKETIKHIFSILLLLSKSLVFIVKKPK